MKTHKRVLVVEDENTLRLVLSKTVSKAGYLVDSAKNIAQARNFLSGHDYIAAFFDIRLPDGNGLDLLPHPAEKNSCACVVMTAEATMNNAVKAVKRGAFEYLVKPFDLSEIDRILERVEQRIAMTGSAEGLPAVAAKEVGKYEIIGRSPAMQKLYKKIGKAAASNYTVLITGQSGTGKELVAHNLHNFSDRARNSFVTVNCSAIPKELMESELFGYVKGAFTGAESDRKGLLEEADRGTLFMDEIGETGLKMQAKLLRLLEEGRITPLGSRKSVPIDVRFIAATNRDLSQMVEEGLFREDLYHRINVIPITVPPLSRRAGDVELLAKYFVKRYGGGRKISDEACEALAVRSWPGNVRQLFNVIKRTLVMSTSHLLTPEKFPVVDEEAPEALDAWIGRQLRKGGDRIHHKVIGEIESEIIRQALELCGGNKIKAAKLLGVNRNTLTKKVKDYALE
ncbi:MAG: sigma-54-dependent transcriptional regulator [Nitrospinota bacterium]